jgi:hypothetical protein
MNPIIKSITFFLGFIYLIILCFFPNISVLKSPCIAISIFVLFIVTLLIKSKKVRQHSTLNRIKMFVFIYFNIFIYYCFWIYFSLILILYFLDIKIHTLIAYGFWLILGAYISSFICLKLYDLEKNDKNKDTVKEK